MNLNFKSGLFPSPEDYRDYITTAIIPTDMELKASFSWKDKIPLIRDQKSYGTCVGHAGSAIKNIHETVENTYVDGGFCPLFLYTLCKSFDGIPEEEGTYLSTAMFVLRNYGICPEIYLPYELLQDIRKLPVISDKVKQEAEKYKISTYAKIPSGNLVALKQAIKISPVMMGVLVTSSFMNNENGFLNTPFGALYGGHAITIIGWDDNLEHKFKNGKTKKGFLIFQNSWGTIWGDNGIGYIAYEDLGWKDDLGRIFVYDAWSCVDSIIPKPEPIEPKPDPKPIIQKYYKVQLFAFSQKLNAENAVKKLKEQGFNTWIPPKDNDNLYRVQVGAFQNKENAIKLADRLKDLGYKPWVRYI